MLEARRFAPIKVRGLRFEAIRLFFNDDHRILFFRFINYATAGASQGVNETIDFSVNLLTTVSDFLRIDLLEKSASSKDLV